MALTKQQIQDGLKKRGLTEAHAAFLSFENETELNTYMDAIAPRSFTSVDELLADDKLKGLVSSYVDKRVTDAQKKWEKDKGAAAGGGSGANNNSSIQPDLTQVISAAITEAVKPLTEKINSLEAGKQEEARKAKISKALSDQLPAELHSFVEAKIPKEATDADIIKIIGESKAEFVKLGLKNIGLPSGGTSGATGAKTEIDAWAEAKKPKK